MKGIIFNLVDEVVRADRGEDAWDDVLDAAGASGAYTALGNYPDAELLAIVDATAETMDVARADALRWVGQHAMPLLAERYPGFFAVPDLRAFLLNLNDVIHAEVRKLYPEALVPVFTFEDGPDGTLRMGYESPRALCYLAEGFVLGAAHEFDAPVSVEQDTCTWRGDDVCRIDVHFG